MLTTGGPDEIAVTTVRGVRVAVVGFAPYGWAAPLNDPAAVRSLVRRAAAWADIVVVVFHGGAEGTDALHVPAGRETASARTAATCGRSPGPRWPPARTPCSAPARTSSAEPRSSPAARWRTPWATSWATACCPPPACSAPPRSSSSTFRADGGWVGGLLRPTRQVQPGYPEPDPDRAAITLVRRLSTEDFGPTAMRVGADGTLRPPVYDERRSFHQRPLAAGLAQSTEGPAASGRPAQDGRCRRGSLGPAPAPCACAGASLVSGPGCRPEHEKEAHGEAREDRGRRRDH